MPVLDARRYVLLDRTLPRLAKPDLGITRVRVGSRLVAVRETTIAELPFATLRRFARPASPGRPRLLVVTPMSGHYPEIVRDLLVALLADCDVHVTDWRDARDVPAADGRFGLDDNIAYVMDFLRVLGPDAHVLGLCQSAPVALAAAALLADADDACQPVSLVLVSGPIDARIRPTRVNRLLAGHDLAWFERTVIGTVPKPFVGAGRRVYPAFVQFMALMQHLARHVGSGLELGRKVLQDDGADPIGHPFLRMYSALMDVPAELFLESVERMFHTHLLARGKLRWRGMPVDPAALRRTALMTVEGGRDDICGLGQTAAAHEICCNVPPSRRCHHLEADAGHFGTFHGHLWRTGILPNVRAFLRAAAEPPPVTRSRKRRPSPKRSAPRSRPR